MRILTAALLVAVTVLLSSIAYDLHQLAKTAGVVTGVGGYGAHQTAEQLRRSVQQSGADDAALLKAAATPAAKTSR